MKKIFLFLALMVNTMVFSQTFMNEVGGYLGVVSTQTDYGERGDFKSNTGNIGMSIGFFHVLSFYNGRSFLEENLRLRTEYSFSSTNLKYYGAYVDPADTSLAANQLRAMKGKTSYSNLGSQLELNILNIRKRNGDVSIYGALGGMYTFGTSTVFSELGNINNSGVLPSFLTDDLDEYRNDKFTTISLTAGFGVNIDLSRDSRLFFEYRNQFFMSDWVDGLNAKNFEPNKYNDTAAQLTFGIAFHIGR